jgi:hypothetical protein
VKTSAAAAPGVAVAVKVTGVRPVRSASSVCGPAVVPRVHVVCASPAASVTARIGVVDPAEGVKVTVSPGMPLPMASRTRTTSG